MVGSEKLVRVVAKQAPQFGQQPNEVSAVGADVPLGFEPDVLMDDAYAQAVENVFGAVVARGQTVEVGLLGMLQALKGGCLRNEAAGFLELGEMGVKVVHEVPRHILQTHVQLREQADIGFAELQECLAPGDLLRVYSDRPGQRGDGLVREIHSPAPTIGPQTARGMSGLLACLLAQYFFHDIPQPLFILVHVLGQAPL
ncbi:MAG: hypothetical protein A3I83_00325 [Methylotenera sp. RIFCSPLOWO2_02_FULL_45_14]|nr:MAG: hypothetical protein A3I83_00325 [Methylotenera sp. RIFCSPLOWO2_02_FULL_45_14]